MYVATGHAVSSLYGQTAGKFMSAYGDTAAQAGDRVNYLRRMGNLRCKADFLAMQGCNT